MQVKTSNAVPGASPAAMLAVEAVLVLGGVFTAPASGQCLANEIQKFTASDASLGDHFGTSVHIRGDLMIVGANLDDDGGLNTGATYVLRFDPGSSQWTEEQKLTAVEPVEQSDFGISVAINPVDRNLVIVGAWLDDEIDFNTGAAYVFRFNGEQWVQEQKLLASDASFWDHFGTSVAIWGDVAMVGSWLDDDPDPDTGSVYVFQYDPDSGIWNEVQKLIPSDWELSGRFGRSVSLQGDTAVIGSPTNHEVGFQAGAAYVYRFDGTQWIQEQKLVASDGDDNDIFGWSVSIDGDVALIGAYGDNLGPMINAGSAYVFRFNGSQWVQEQKLTASDGLAGDFFGWSVSLSGNIAVIGADLDDDGGPSSGSAFVFRYQGGEWVETAKILSADLEPGDVFGISVSTDGQRAIVGANFSDDACDPGENCQSGSAYVFGSLGDCNENGELDLCDIADGFSPDENTNGIPDECEIPDCPGDLDNSGDVGVKDLLFLVGTWGPCPPKGDCLADFDDSGEVGVKDLLILLGNWGPCP